MHTALSRVKNYGNLYCIGEFENTAIKVKKDALLKYKFPTIKRNVISGDTVTVLVYNVRSFPKHVDDIVSDNRTINNDIIGFTESQIKPSDSTMLKECGFKCD